ncbi:poly(A)-specific ribonuclease PARN isoform X2 [Pistacia vera]|nr:poly(A)-specific ribonuclease PARN isoform X2 [Pistacia vera]
MNSLYEDKSWDSWGDLKEARDMPLVNIADVLFTERMKHRLREWYDWLLRDRNGRSSFPGSSNDSEQQFQTIFYKMRPAISLNGFTSHQLKLIQLVVNKHFKDLVYLRVKGENSCSQHLVVYNESEDDKKLLMKEVKDEQLRETEMKIKAAIGFRHVIDCLSSEKKLIVGHNCFLDVAHIYGKFLGALPLTAEEFISSVNKYLPHIIDTKILLKCNDVLVQRMKKSGTSLFSAFSRLCQRIAIGSKSSHLLIQPSVKVEIEVDDNRSSDWNSGVRHEAGYDAFMTGCVFAQACSHLGIDFTLHSSSENLALNEKLQKYINLLYLSWSNGDIINLSSSNLSSLSSVSSSKLYRNTKILFSHIVLVWGFPSKLKAREIRECISKVFGSTSVTSVYHVDETAVFVQFKKEEMVPLFLELKESLESSNDAVSVLHPLSKLLKGGNTCAASYETYKEICSSPISKVLFADQAKAVGIKWKTKLVESKVEVETQENKSSHEEHSLNSGENTTIKKIDVRNDPSHSQVSSDEIDDDSFYSTQIKQIRTSL